MVAFFLLVFEFCLAKDGEKELKNHKNQDWCEKKSHARKKLKKGGLVAKISVGPVDNELENEK